MTASTLEGEYVTDTMAFILRVESRKSSPLVRSIFDGIESGDIDLYVPGIVFAEILYLSEKKRIRASFSEIKDYVTHHLNIYEVPLSLSVLSKAEPITDIPELHDRLIAATAAYMNSSLITNDPVIRASAFVKCIW